MNSDNLKITIHAEGCSATDLLKILGASGSGGRASTESTAIPTWVSEFREAIMRLEETIEKNNSCRLGAQKQIIAQYEGLTSQVAGLTSQVGDISSKVGGVSLEVTGLSARCDALSAQCSTLSGQRGSGWRAVPRSRWARRREDGRMAVGRSHEGGLVRIPR